MGRQAHMKNAVLFWFYEDIMSVQRKQEPSHSTFEGQP